jgi:hypothetical protein
MAAKRVGIQGWFNHYALLGDDIVIADESVAGAYLAIMAGLGVPINHAKSFAMESGGLEFAKRWINPLFGDVSPMSPGLIMAAIRNPRMIPALLLDSLGRGYVFSSRVVSDLYRTLRMLRPTRWVQKYWNPIFSMVFGPAGGLWKTASGPLFKAVWIASFPHQVVNKLGMLVSTLYKLHADSQKPPLSEEESMALLVSNFWKQVIPDGSFHWGLLWLPLLISSPAFWVYYDLAAKAEERHAEWKAKAIAFDRAVWGGFVGRFFEDFYRDRAIALERLVKSTFDPGLIDWTRTMTEDGLRRHSALRVAWLEKVRKWEVEDRLAENRNAYIRRLGRKVTPIHLSLVPVGFVWWTRQHILLRHGEVPAYGPTRRS